MKNLAVAPTSDSRLALRQPEVVSYIYDQSYVPVKGSVQSTVMPCLDPSEGQIEREATEAANEVYYLYGRLNDDLTLVRPLRVTLSWTPTGLVADQEELSMFAFGDDRIDALVNLAERIIEDYDLTVR